LFNSSYLSRKNIKKAEEMKNPKEEIGRRTPNTEHRHLMAYPNKIYKFASPLKENER